MNVVPTTKQYVCDDRFRVRLFETIAQEPVVHEELGSRLHADTIRELQHYFFHRRWGTDLTTIPENLRAIITRYADVYGGPRLTHLYKRWLADKHAALTPVTISDLPDTW
jgi:hypothetical protein